MAGFWILAALLLAAAYAFFAPALLGRRRGAAIDRQRLNLLLHRQRREELTGELGGQPSESLEAELDKDLLGDLAAAERGAKAAGGRGGLLAALALAPVLGLVLYSMLGRPDLADFRAAATAAPKKAGAPEFQEMVERLAERLKTDSQDLNGWLLLARSCQQLEQFDRAADAYAHAMKLAPDNLSVKALYAEALGESLNGDFTGEPAKIAAEILAKDPKQHNALWLAGAAAAQTGDTAQAIAYLETLRGEFPPGSPDDKHLGKIIEDLKHGGAEAEAETADAAEQEGGAAAELPATGEQKSIRVKVGLAAALKSKASPEDVVFIFARAASGPPMPLAIVRKKVKDLPVEVTLDDSMSMVEGMNLSAFDQLVIGARVSKSGQAMPQPGDLQGLTRPLAAENEGVYAVEIGEVVK
jgi:cytochrome c-type biogenesis protein CcmH